MDDDTALDEEPGGVRVSCQVPSYCTDIDRFTTLADRLCQLMGTATAEVNIELMDDEAIRQLNKSYRGIDRATDVLAFPQLEWTEPLMPSTGEVPATLRQLFSSETSSSPPLALGDIAISLPEAERNADKIGQSLSREVCFLTIHGLLHLVGHDHHDADEERLMLAEQDYLLARLAEGGTTPWEGLVTGVAER